MTLLGAKIITVAKLSGEFASLAAISFCSQRETYWQPALFSQAIW
jgi:hypothetical protein